MATFRFLHCADLHLDSPLRGLEADPDAPVDKIRGATREALQNMVNFAIDQRVDFVVAAGDLYDGDWQDWRTGRFLLDQATYRRKNSVYCHSRQSRCRQRDYE
jgi:exonuclease SbcD